MKTLSLISQKGGSGKTTLALSLATIAEQAGYSTVLIDLDPQQSAKSWSDHRNSDTPVVISAQAIRLNEILETAKNNGADLVIIDTAPHSETTALAACRASDFVLVPCRPALLDLHAIKETHNLIQLSKAKAAAVLNAVPPRGTMGEQAMNVIQSAGLDVVPVQICQRAAFVHALTNGQSVSEFEPQSKAAQEVKALFAWTFDQVEKSEITNNTKELNKVNT